MSIDNIIEGYIISYDGLFLSIPESKPYFREMEKFRGIEEITPSNLGKVKMMGEDKKQP